MTRHMVKRVFTQVCKALAYLHEQGIMHRDIKVLKLPLLSPKTSYSTNRVSPNCAISDSQRTPTPPETPSAAPTNTCHLR
jgi:serine/threonine protein kinase